MKVRIWVFFSEKDLLKSISLVDDNDFVICEINKVKYPKLNIVNVWETKIKEEIPIEKVKLLFAELSKKYGNEIIGFSNNFYQCSLVLLLKYIQTIKNVYDTNPISYLYFVNRVFFSTEQPNYFLAEYESAGETLYSREDVFLKPLIGYCKSNRIPFEFHKKRMSYQYIFNILRVYLVFFIKFIRDIKQAKIVNGNMQEQNKESDFIFISRSYTQSQYLKKITTLNKYKNKILIMNGFYDSAHYDTALKLFDNQDNVSIERTINIEVFQVIMNYIKALKYIAQVPKIIFELDNISLNITQAIKEILVMLPEVILYKKQLEKTLSIAGIVSTNIVFSTEQKSPHAYIDAQVAKQLKFKCIQLMQCDQDNSNLPIPIPSDLFIPISKEKRNSFFEAWKNDQKKIFFPCRIKDYAPYMQHDIKFKICYFASFHEKDSNIEVVKYLKKLSFMYNFKFLVKLHPRDKSDWWKNFEDHCCKIIKHHDVEQTELFRLFEVAILNISAVAISLIECKKKYILLDLKNSNYQLEDIFYIDKEYKPIVKNINDIAYWIENSRLLECEFEGFRNRYLYKHGEECSSNIFFNRIVQKCKREL